MRSRLSIGAMLLVLPILQTPAPPPAAPRPATRPAPLTAAECKCSIEITVKRQSNGELLPDVGLVTTFVPVTQFQPTDAGTLPSTPVAPATLTATTDNAGHATFSNLAEGTYTIRAQREGFFAPVVNGYASTQVFASAAVGPASGNKDSLIARLVTNAAVRGSMDPASAGNRVPQPVQHVSIAMIPGSVISGRIQDANHRPASEVQVVPFQVAYQNGQRVLRQTMSQIQTDDLGQFRLFWFAPGEYYLRAMVPPAQSSRGGGPNFPSPTYYPGTLDPARATLIVVQEGEEFNGADFELQASKGVTISGTVTNLLPGRIGPNGQVTRAISTFLLARKNPIFQEPPQSIPNASLTGARGAASLDATVFPFEIRGVPPGSYDFYPIFNDGAPAQSNAYTGHLSIAVGTENITGIQTSIQPGLGLKIHLNITGNPPPAPANRPAQPLSLQNVRMVVLPADNVPAQLSQGGVFLLGTRVAVNAGTPLTNIQVSLIPGDH